MSNTNVIPFAGNSEVLSFSNEQFGTVRIVELNGEPWFVGRDIASTLGYAKPQNAVIKWVDDEDKKGAPIRGTPGGTQFMTVINESGLYSLILSSKLPAAKQFKKWITHEVIPSIRKHGVYATPDTVEHLLNDPDFAIKTFTALKEERAARQLAEQKQAELEHQAQINAPKVLLADSITASDSTITIGAMAKILCQNGVNIGRNRLFETLRNYGFLMNTKTDRNIPTQSAMNRGLLVMVETTYTDFRGTHINRSVRVTGTGQSFFVNKYAARLA